MIALPEIDLEAECRSAGGAPFLDVAERVVAVDRRVAHPEQVQIGAVQNKDGRQARPPLAIACLYHAPPPPGRSGDRRCCSAAANGTAGSPAAGMRDASQ